MTKGIPNQLRFHINRIREKLWVKPLMACLASVGVAFLAKIVDQTNLSQILPEISRETLEALLSIMASSMLVIATLAVASMVSAYASTSSTATPRSFRLVVADDVSQNALSVFIGAFIFSIVALTAATSSYFGMAGRFTLFLITAAVLVLVVITFARWVDRIARLGRLVTTIDKVEEATAAAIRNHRRAPRLHGLPMLHPPENAQPVYAHTVGYVQRVHVPALQDFATKTSTRIVVAALPGAFATLDRPIAYINQAGNALDVAPVTHAFVVGDDRLFDDDPRFGLVVLSEIAGRALSPAVNDPGTAIDVIGTLVRLFTLWVQAAEEEDSTGPTFDRVEVPQLSVLDLFDDAFTAIARDGAGMIEVSIRLQKAFNSLASLGDSALREAARHHARMALARSEKALTLPEEVSTVRELARFATRGEFWNGTSQDSG